MRIIGIDPGLSATGYSILEIAAGSKPKLVEAGIIKPVQNAALSVRLKSLYEDFLKLLQEAKPEKAAIEDLYSHYKYPKTAIIMGHCRGVIMLACANADVEVVSFAATKIKKSVTGNGRANKEQVSRAVASYLDLEPLKASHDLSDALAVSLTLANSISHKEK